MEEHVFEPKQPHEHSETPPSEPEHHMDDEDNTEMIQTIIRLVIGLVIVIAIGIGAVYTYFNFRPRVETAKSTKPTPTKAIVKNTPAPTQKASTQLPTAKPTQKVVKPTPTQKPLNITQGVPSDWKLFEDSTYKFQIKTPKNWEVFKRAGDNTSYQYGARPLGSSDVPVTITLQPNSANQTLDQWVDDVYGPGTPRTKGKIAGKDSLFVKNEAQNFVTYYVMNGSNVYEFSSAVANTEYYNVFEKIIASLKFN